jgi:hypothetical protein
MKNSTLDRSAFVTGKCVPAAARRPAARRPQRRVSAVAEVERAAANGRARVSLPVLSLA